MSGKEKIVLIKSFSKFCVTCATSSSRGVLFSFLYDFRLEESDFNGQSIGRKMKIQLKRPALNNFKAYVWK